MAISSRARTTVGGRSAATGPGWIAAAVLTAAAVGTAAAIWPIPLLLVIAATTGALLLLLRLDLAALTLVATVPLETSIQIGSLPQLTITKLAGGVCFLSFLGELLVRRRRLHLDRTHAILAALLGLALASTSAARSVSDAGLVTLRYASFVALYLVITQLGADRRLLERIVWILSAACALAAVLALVNFVTGTTALARPRYGDPNDFAFILATTLPLTAWLLGSGSWRRLAAAALLGIMSVGVLASLSRGAITGLAAGILLIAVTDRRRLRVVAGGLAVTAGVALVLGVTRGQRLQAGLAEKGHVAGLNISTRFSAWQEALVLTSEHPLLGAGPGNFHLYAAAAADRPPTADDPGVVHDAYLDVAAELGAGGLVLFSAYLWLSFGRLRQAVSQGLGPPGLAVALRCGLVVAAVAALTLSEQFYAPFWLLGALGTVIWRVDERRPVGR